MKNPYLEEIAVKNPAFSALIEKTKDEKNHVAPRSTLFVCAMEEELAGFSACLSHLDIPHEYMSYDGHPYLSFEYHGRKSMAMYTGLSFFHAPVLCRMLEVFHPDQIINFGTCAGIRGQKTGSIIKTNQAYCNDLDARMFGFQLGTIDKDPMDLSKDALVSGSTFLSSSEEIAKVLEKFPNAVGFDMESFMFACVCKFYHIPFMVIRAVTDGGDEESKNDFFSYVTKCASFAAYYAILDVLVSEYK